MKVLPLGAVSDWPVAAIRLPLPLMLGSSPFSPGTSVMAPVLVL